MLYFSPLVSVDIVRGCMLVSMRTYLFSERQELAYSRTYRFSIPYDRVRDPEFALGIVQESRKRLMEDRGALGGLLPWEVQEVNLVAGFERVGWKVQ